MKRDPRPDIREQLGVSFSASTLRMNGSEPGSETHLQRIAALGAAALHVAHGADLRGEPIATVINAPRHEPNPQDVLNAELGRELYHIRHGGQHERLGQAVELFSQWLVFRARIQVALSKRDLTPSEWPLFLRQFSQRTLHEWLSDRCIACGGTGKLERSPTGAWIKPRGAMQRNATFRVCTTCEGSRRQPASHGDRARSVGLTPAQYDAERWDVHFGAALIWLTKLIERRLKKPLTVQLERSTKRT